MATLRDAKPGCEVFTSTGEPVGVVIKATDNEIAIALDLRGFDKPLRIDKRRQRLDLASIYCPVPFVSQRLGSSLFLGKPAGV